MKKIIVLFAALAAIFCLAFTANAAIGDANGDGALTVGDARTVLRVALDLQKIPLRLRPVCDADHNGEITVSDARAVLRAAIGLEGFTHPAYTGDEPVVGLQPATCTAAGVLRYRCACGDVFAVSVPAKGHAPGGIVKEKLRRPTCAKEGSYDAVIYCAACKAELSREKHTVERLPHTPGEAVEENLIPATCVSVGGYDTVVYCTVCGGEYSRVHITLGKLRHVSAPAVKENKIAPACDTAGSYESVVYCRDCGAELSRETVTLEALGHSLTEVIPAAYIGETPEKPAAAFGCANCGLCFSDAAAQTLADGYYADLNAALQAAKEGETVVLLRSAELNEDITVPAGVTLLVPYSFDNVRISGTGSRELHYANTAANGSVPEVTPAGENVFVTLRLAGGTLTVEEGALLAVGGVYSGLQPVGGAVYGPHGEIELAENASLIVKGKLSVMGYITGEGSVSLTGGALYEPFIITDYHGGTYSAISFAGHNQLPFCSYAVMGVQCPLTMDGTSSVYGYGALYASGEHNVSTSLMIGPENALLCLSPETNLSFTYNAAKTVPGYPHLGRTEITAAGDVTLNSVSLKAAGLTMDLSVTVFSVPYTVGYTQQSGALTLAQDLALMPGASLSVAPGASLNVLKKLLVLEGFAPGLYSAYHYPAGEKLAEAGYSARGSLIVDGRMTVADGACFAGTAETNGTGTLTVGDAALSAVFTDGLMKDEVFVWYTSIATNKTEYALSARLANAAGELVPMEANRTYTAVSGEKTALTGWEYVRYGGAAAAPESETVQVSYAAPETVTGRWA